MPCKFGIYRLLLDFWDVQSAHIAEIGGAVALPTEPRWLIIGVARDFNINVAV